MARLRGNVVAWILVTIVSYVLQAAPGVAPSPDGGAGTPGPPDRSPDPDVVVLGGTPAGVAAAIAAAGQGARVTLVAEGRTVGGTMANGLSASDIGAEQAVQGVARTFFDEVSAYYRGRSTWRFEPRIAERILRRMLDDAGVDVRLEQDLDSVRMAGRRVECLVLAGGEELCAPNHVDASYTGDLIAAAGVPHRLGTADLHAYGEYMAQRRTWVEVLRVPRDQVGAATAAFEAHPFVRTGDALPDLAEAVGDGRPSMTYRLCVTPDPGNRTPFRPGPQYAEWAPAFRVLARAAGPDVEVKGNGTLMSDLFHLARLPGGKYDLNAGLLSFTNMPAPDEYVADPGTRRAHEATLRHYVESFFHFVGTDETVPREVREAFAPFGLCADEFTDNGNWPYEPYVREGRRIEGRETVTVSDVFADRRKTDAVALGSYHVDGKLSQLRFVDGVLHRDMAAFSKAPVYEIPFGAMVPKRGSVTNLLAPVGLSASPTAYGSLRMEPQYMALGQAAGIAAALATDAEISVAALPAARVQAVLRADGVGHRAADVCREMAVPERARFGFAGDCRVRPVAPG